MKDQWQLSHLESIETLVCNLDGSEVWTHVKQVCVLLQSFHPSLVCLLHSQKCSLYPFQSKDDSSWQSRKGIWKELRKFATPAKCLLMFCLSVSLNMLRRWLLYVYMYMYFHVCITLWYIFYINSNKFIYKIIHKLLNKCIKLFFFLELTLPYLEPKLTDIF